MYNKAYVMPNAQEKKVTNLKDQSDYYAPFWSWIRKAYERLLLGVRICKFVHSLRSKQVDKSTAD